QQVRLGGALDERDRPVGAHCPADTAAIAARCGFGVPCSKVSLTSLPNPAVVGFLPAMVNFATLHFHHIIKGDFMFFRSTTHAPVSRTALRAGAAAFAVGIIGAGLMTTGASAESEELAYQCSADGEDDTYQVWFAFETDAPQSADENEEFRIDPASADVRMAPETWGHFLGDEGNILGDFTFTINVLPAGTSPGDDGTSDQDVTMNSTYRGSYPDPGD